MILSALEDLAFAQRVIRHEGEALLHLSQNLGQEFLDVVALLLKTQGRIIWTGMGKCSHIARKAASTMASTGTPALFIHPAEASHGDLGMITGQDVVLVLSNSGETSELGPVIHHTRRYGIPLIAITRDAESMLARGADLRLILPYLEEACPIGLAPTTSTTMMLALSDGLALALLKHKSFGVEDFKNLHPGGQIGQILLRVEEVMHRGDALPLVFESTCMREALVVMTQKSLGCLGVVDAEQGLIGIITDGDLRRHMSPDLLDLCASDVMTSHPQTVPPQAWLSEALRQMQSRKITSLFVLDAPASREPLGLIHMHQCLERGIV